MKYVSHFINHYLLRWVTYFLFSLLAISFIAAVISFYDTLNVLITPSNSGVLYKFFPSLGAIKTDSKEVLYLLLNFFVLFVTIIALILSTISYYNLKLKVQSKSSIKTKELSSKDENEDIKLMANYYKNADHVNVFAGDFNWINNTHIKDIVDKLIEKDKIKFFSSKSKETVQNAIGSDLFNKLVKNHQLFFVKFDDAPRISLIIKNGTRTLLYKISKNTESGTQEFMNSFVDTNDSSYALYFIGQLIKQIKSPPKKRK